MRARCNDVRCDEHLNCFVNSGRLRQALETSNVPEKIINMIMGRC